jgi:signal peptidase II
MKNEQKMILFSVAAVFDVVLFDLLLKYAVRWNWIPEIELINGILAITKHENYGLIGNLAVPYFIIIALTLIAFVVLFYGYKTSFLQNRFYEALALAYIAGGALGNLIDRVVNGYVFDWILLFNTSIINIADIAITLGIIGYVASHYHHEKIKVFQD